MPLIQAKYAHTNLISRDWQKLSQFYITVFGCEPVPPERHFKGTDLEQGTGLPGAELHGIHLQLPGYGSEGPTLELFSYSMMEENGLPAVNKHGFGHIAFAVPNVHQAREIVLSNGGKAVGEVVTLETATGKRVTWCYVTDPEGNIIELQAWE